MYEVSVGHIAYVIGVEFLKVKSNLIVVYEFSYAIHFKS
jgi:hypothetical protein